MGIRRGACSKRKVSVIKPIDENLHNVAGSLLRSYGTERTHQIDHAGARHERQSQRIVNERYDHRPRSRCRRMPVLDFKPDAKMGMSHLSTGESALSGPDVAELLDLDVRSISDLARARLALSLYRQT